MTYVVAVSGNCVTYVVDVCKHCVAYVVAVCKHCAICVMLHVVIVCNARKKLAWGGGVLP